MATVTEWVRSLQEVDADDVAEVGGKGARLGQLTQAGLRVPSGFVITTHAYEAFLREAGLVEVIEMELGRKDLTRMRWEEMWDAALRIRSAFARAPLPAALERSVLDVGLPEGPVAVRSSAPAEDGAQRSFAGLHATVLGCRGRRAVLAAVREVWASLWSDTALLYRRELGLDPRSSRMAVVVQEQVEGEVSGVAFGLDPRDPRSDRVLIEAVPGLCQGLVDGTLDPDHYVLERSTGRLLERRRGADAPPEPLLAPEDLEGLRGLLAEVAQRCGWPADLEWTRRAGALIVLQARPASAASALPDDERRVYRSYCPEPQELERLSRQVSEELIPALGVEGARLAAAEVESLGDEALAEALEERAAALVRWRSVYAEAFIPFAHGARALGLFYNAALQPTDAHEFLGLLRGERFLATERNAFLEALGAFLHARPSVRSAVASLLETGRAAWPELSALLSAEGRDDLRERLEELLSGTLDVAFEGVRLINRPDLVLGPVVAGPSRPREPDLGPTPAEFEERLWEAVGPTRRAEAHHVLEVARLSWRLRDDDNILLGRIESQLLRAVEAGAARLRARGALEGRAPGVDDAAAVAQALRQEERLSLPAATGSVRHPSRVVPRQLVGQPASPGLATGPVSCVRRAADLGLFSPGDVLVCDAIQPQMTHLVPLASAVVERRGGMLIHGAIIARELGIPCVNGVPAAAEILSNGTRVTVDGDLGLVTIGTTDLPPRS